MDTMLGILKGIKEYDLSSRAMKEGLIKNGSVLLVVWVLYFIMPPDFDIPMDVITSGFVASHLISVFENLYKIGARLPKNMIKRLREYEETLHDNIWEDNQRKEDLDE